MEIKEHKKLRSVSEIYNSNISSEERRKQMIITLMKNIQMVPANMKEQVINKI